MKAVANAINVLQACICKSLKTGPFLKPLIAPHIVKFNMLMPVFTIKYQVLLQKNMILWNKTTLVATNDFKNRPLLTGLYRPVKHL